MQVQERMTLGFMGQTVQVRIRFRTADRSRRG